MMTIDNELKELVHLVMPSHDHCGHNDLNLCYLLMSHEIELRRGRALDEDESTAVGDYIADQVLEELILKGAMEPSGVNDEGEMTFGVTDAGNQALERSREGTNG